VNSLQGKRRPSLGVENRIVLPKKKRGFGDVRKGDVVGVFVEKGRREKMYRVHSVEHA